MASNKWVDSFSWTGRGATGGNGSGGVFGSGGGGGSLAEIQAQQLVMQQLQGLAERQQLIQHQQLIRQQELIQMAEVQASPVETLGSGEVIDRYEIKDHTPEAIEVVIEKPVPSVLTEIKTDLKEYAELANLVGIAPAELTIESFKAFLYEHDIPVFNLKEVIAYMDAKAKKESKNQAGWEWRPLRQKDHRVSTTFGKRAGRELDYRGYETGPIIPGSDHYQYPGEGSYALKRIYDKLVPLHALKKVALIDKHFGDKVGMFVCDYAPIPAIQYPDPFLMAVIANPRVKEGEGRFVIDFWNEPGFGLQSQLK